MVALMTILARSLHLLEDEVVGILLPRFLTDITNNNSNNNMLSSWMQIRKDLNTLTIVTAASDVTTRAE
jgi:hypothetical protein